MEEEKQVPKLVPVRYSVFQTRGFRVTLSPY
jgi:hypothetical protein